MRKRTAAIASALTIAIGASAGAVAPTDKAERPFETASRAARPYRSIVRTAPASAQLPLARVAAAGLERVLWDRDTDVASQLSGAGIPAPGAVTSAPAAEAAARAFLAEHAAVVAPGADLVLATNVQREDLRAVVFTQTLDGMPVVGTHVAFYFKHDRLVIVSSTAVPVAALGPATGGLTADTIRGGASSWITAVTGKAATASDVGTRVVLPIIHRRSGAGPDVEYRVVHPVKVALSTGVGAWDVYVDPASAAPVARRSRLQHGTGTIEYNVPERHPGGVRSLFAAAFATHIVDGGQVTSTATGGVTWTGTAAATVAPGLSGPRVRVQNGAGAIATTSLSLANGGSVTWDETASSSKDGQLTSFIHTNIVKDYVKANIFPNLAWVDSRLDVNVNLGGNCNAFWDGQSLNFFPADSQCENTARLADVVYHEFGHGLQQNGNLAGNFDGSLGEGQADFLAALVTGDHGMGRGFFFSESPLRDLDPTGSELVYPQDLTGEVHADGEIIGQALWDMRKALIAELGEAEGVALSQRVYKSIVQTADDIPGCYAAALVADDDDGNLANGTPHECAIKAAFAIHGLAEGGIVTSTGIGNPTLDGLTVTVPVTPPPAAECPAPSIVGGTLRWNVRGGGSPASIALVETDVGGGSSTWSATIPPQTDATVVNYRISLTLTNGNILSYPDNAADPDYELYIGQVEEIWCDDFEAGAIEWTHGTDGGADEWQAGAPGGLGEDPTAAFEGTGVFGIDLTSDGAYAAGREQWAKTPVIDVTGRDGVRLQYQRWLGVEDAHFDLATISADDTVKWTNFDSDNGNGSNVHHRDREWRFHDVDLAAEAADGSVQVEFRLGSDGGLELGGWTMDRVCIVGRLAGGVCGDGTAAGVEQCDDGNTTDGDGCSATCQDEGSGDDEPGMDAGCCSTGSGPGGPLVLGLLTVGAIVRRRRRRLP